MSDVDDLWPLKDIAHDLEVSDRQLTVWSQRKTTGFPPPKRKVGKYNLYSFAEVSEWFTLWQRVTARMGRGDELNGTRGTHGGR